MVFLCRYSIAQGSSAVACSLASVALMMKVRVMPPSKISQLSASSGWI